jgi:hypothetical protein
MENNNKKALEINQEPQTIHNLIITGKTYTVKELACIFNYKVLMLIDDKETLLKYYYMAVETGVKRFRDIVDSVIERKFYR